jgi:hypothetical protein
MRVCTCPECGEDLFITCPSGHARAAAGACEAETLPAIRAAREHPKHDAPHRRRARRRGGLRAGSVATLLCECLGSGSVCTVVQLLDRVRELRPDATRANVDVTLCSLVRTGRVQRVGRGQYRGVVA